MAEVDKTNELPEEEVEESEVDVEIEGEEQIPEEQQPEEDFYRIVKNGLDFFKDHNNLINDVEKK